MPSYIALIRFTQKGIENIKEGPTRLDAAKKAFEAGGGKVVSFFLTMGQYDAIVITEFPNDESIAKVALAGASQGFIRTESLRAFTEDEYRNIIRSLP
ncbi:MAG: GYD domain-containing protein [Acidobacteriaceae bacterium]|nr:GYD domain-containing protein [Acidobacteriaceae bacterium]MBV9294373.1 GYD domain-containing protein [Acidobacteriaceae bacterium]MBV9296548.1 GYD domain-containing protein [Acidobacteriaceae bacterium]MBV9765620.1 GYD domain-containing protein [Acidobacteriaceae bacterium]